MSELEGGREGGREGAREGEGGRKKLRYNDTDRPDRRLRLTLAGVILSQSWLIPYVWISTETEVAFFDHGHNL